MERTSPPSSALRAMSRWGHRRLNWLRYLCAAFVLLVPVFTAPAVHAAPPTPADVCTAAAMLNDLHRPQQASALLRNDPTTNNPLACEAELTAAQGAINTAQAAALEAKTAAGKGSWEEAVAKAQQALGVDAENGIATEVAAQAAEPNTPVDEVAGWWDATLEDYVKPAGKLAVPFLTTLIVLFVLARLLTIVRWPLVEQDWPLVTRVGWPLAGTGKVLTVSALVSGLVAAALLPARSHYPWPIWVVAVVGVVAPVTGALWLAKGPLSRTAKVRWTIVTIVGLIGAAVLPIGWKNSWPIWIAPVIGVVAVVIGSLWGSLWLASELVPRHSRAVLSIAVFAGLAASLLVPTWSRDPWLVWATAAFGVVAVATGSLWLASRLRIHLEARGPQGDVSEPQTAHLAALLRELAGEEPRGLEIPRGSDVEALKDTPLAGTPEGKIAKLIASLMRILVGTSPWRVQVEEIDADTLAVTVTRNMRYVQSALIQRSALGLDVPITAAADKKGTDAEPASPSTTSAISDATSKGNQLDLYQVAAAVVVVQLAKCHTGFEELGPVTDWRSLGLHFVATTQLDGNRPAQRQALALAVKDDPGNIAAEVAYLYCLYRDKTESDLLRNYSDALTAALTAIRAAPGGLRGSQLERRALHSRLVAEINFAYAKGHVTPAPDTDNLQKAAEDLLDFYATSRSEVDSDSQLPRLTLASLPSAASMLLWAKERTAFRFSKPDSKLSEAQVEADLKCWLEKAGGPIGDYQVGCYYASRMSPDDNRALSHLRRAVTDPKIAEWLPKDPQLNAFLNDPTKTKYHKEFGVGPRTDFFALGPVKSCAAQLANIGVASPEELLDYDSKNLALSLGRPLATAVRLRQLAAGATSPELGDDQEYRVELCHLLLESGLPLPPVSNPDDLKVRRLVEEVNKRFRKTLPEGSVKAWWQKSAPPSLQADPTVPTSPRTVGRRWCDRMGARRGRQ